MTDSTPDDKSLHSDAQRKTDQAFVEMRLEENQRELSDILSCAASTIRLLLFQCEKYCGVLDRIQTLETEAGNVANRREQYESQIEQLERMLAFESLAIAERIHERLTRKPRGITPTPAQSDRFFTTVPEHATPSFFLADRSIDDIADIIMSNIGQLTEAKREIERIREQLKQLQSNDEFNATMLLESEKENRNEYEHDKIPRQLYLLRTDVRQLLQQDPADITDDDVLQDNIAKLQEVLRQLDELVDEPVGDIAGISVKAVRAQTGISMLQSRLERIERESTQATTVDDAPTADTNTTASNSENDVHTPAISPPANIGMVRSTPPASGDPWSRPTLEDLRQVLDSIPKDMSMGERRAAERLDLSVPAEVITSRGSTVPAMTREISRFGIGLLHRCAIPTGEVTVKMASDTREYKYLVKLEWCHPVDNGMFISGGQFLGKLDD